MSAAPRLWLRLEGAAVLIVSALLFHHVSGRWGLFAGLLLLPDLSMIGYAFGRVAGAWAYNVAHSYVLPLTLLAFAWSNGQATLFPIVLVWLAHIGMDRMLGYGLKYESAFGHTHLGPIGRTPVPTDSRNA